MYVSVFYFFNFYSGVTVTPVAPVIYSMHERFVRLTGQLNANILLGPVASESYAGGGYPRCLINAMIAVYRAQLTQYNSTLEMSASFISLGSVAGGVGIRLRFALPSSIVLQSNWSSILPTIDEAQARATIAASKCPAATAFSAPWPPTITQFVFESAEQTYTVTTTSGVAGDSSPPPP